MFELRRLSAGYGQGTVLDDVTLAVPDGVTVALLGPNGAGKTTLLRVAAGLLRPQTGEVVLDGRDITGDSADIRARTGICLVPEGRGVFPALTVAENLRLQAGGRQADLDPAFQAFPVLRQRRRQLAGTLSGGQQQMLALARVFLARPRLVLIDEASMGLAPKLVDEIFEAMEQLAAAGIGLLVVEQYVSRALALADYVYLLNKGRVTFVGEPAELDSDEVFARYIGTGVIDG
jgi:branched-chain amino acid transport system ATP-binding protein